MLMFQKDWLGCNKEKERPKVDKLGGHAPVVTQATSESSSITQGLKSITVQIKTSTEPIYKNKLHTYIHTHARN